MILPSRWFIFPSQPPHTIAFLPRPRSPPPSFTCLSNNDFTTFVSLKIIDCQYLRCLSPPSFGVQRPPICRGNEQKKRRKNAERFLLQMTYGVISYQDPLFFPRLSSLYVVEGHIAPLGRAARAVLAVPRCIPKGQRAGTDRAMPPGPPPNNDTQIDPFFLPPRRHRLVGLPSQYRRPSPPHPQTGKGLGWVLPLGYGHDEGGRRGGGGIDLAAHKLSAILRPVQGE